MNFLTKHIARLNRLVTVLCNNHNSTIGDLNSQILPHLRINSYMGHHVDPMAVVSDLEREEGINTLRFGGDYELYNYIQAVIKGEVYPIERTSWFAGHDAFDLNRLKEQYPLIDFSGTPSIQLGYSFDEDDIVYRGDRDRHDFLYVHPDGTLFYQYREDTGKELVLNRWLTVPGGSNTPRFAYADGKGKHRIDISTNSTNGKALLYASVTETLTQFHPSVGVDAAQALWYVYPADLNNALEKLIHYDDTDGSKLRAKLLRALTKLADQFAVKGSSAATHWTDRNTLVHYKPDEETNTLWWKENRGYGSYPDVRYTTEGLVDALFASNISLCERLNYYLRTLAKLDVPNGKEQNLNAVNTVLRASALLDTDI